MEVPTPIDNIKTITSVYRKNGIATFIYKEGFPFPLNIKNPKAEIDYGILLKKFTDIELTGLFVDRDKSLLGTLNQFMPLILIGGIALIVMILLRGKQAGVP